MHNFLRKNKLQKLASKKIESPNRLIFREKVEKAVWKIKSSKTPGHERFIEEFHQTFIKEIFPILYKLFQGTQIGKKLRFFMEYNINIINMKT